DLATIIHKTIDKEPARRFQTAEDLADDLRRFLEDRPIRARRTSMLERSWRWCRRNPATALSILASLTAFVLLGVAVTALLFNAQLTDSNSKLSEALAEADRQSQRAEQQRLKAEQFLYFN